LASTTNEGVLLLIGAVFFLIGLLGGGFEISAIKIPSIGKFGRYLSGGIGVIFMVLAIGRLMFPALPPQPTVAPTVVETPTPVPTSIAAVPTVTPIPPTHTSAPPINTPSSEIVPGTILTNEDFEDQELQGLEVAEAKKWKFVVDEQGNTVYEAYNRDGDFNPSLTTPWELKDYAIQYRIRFLDWWPPSKSNQDSFAGVSFRFGEGGQYILALDPVAQIAFAAFDLHGGGWNRFETIKFNFVKDIWYQVKVEVQGDKIRVFLDDTLKFDITDSQIQQGRVHIWVANNGHIQFDDIIITALGSP
jgi:hypothetical protein